MTKKVDEYVQIRQVTTLKKELKDTNYTVLEALNNTNILKELVIEKEQAIKLAKGISKSLIPEVQLLSTYIRNEMPPEPEEIYTHKKKRGTTHKKTTKASARKTKTTRAKTKTKTRVRGKQVQLKDESKTLTELKKNLAKIRRQLNE